MKYARRWRGWALSSRHATGWRTTQLGEVADLTFGPAFKSADFTEAPEDIRLLRGDNIAQGVLRWNGVKRWPAGRVEGLLAIF